MLLTNVGQREKKEARSKRHSEGNRWSSQRDFQMQHKSDGYVTIIVCTVVLAVIKSLRISIHQCGLLFCIVCSMHLLQ